MNEYRMSWQGKNGNKGMRQLLTLWLCLYSESRKWTDNGQAYQPSVVSSVITFHQLGSILYFLQPSRVSSSFVNQVIKHMSLWSVLHPQMTSFIDGIINTCKICTEQQNKHFCTCYLLKFISL